MGRLAPPRSPRVSRLGRRGPAGTPAQFAGGVEDGPSRPAKAAACRRAEGQRRNASTTGWRSHAGKQLRNLRATVESLIFTSPNYFPGPVERPNLPWGGAFFCQVSRAKASFSTKVDESVADSRANVHFPTVKRRTSRADSARTWETAAFSRASTQEWRQNPGASATCPGARPGPARAGQARAGQARPGPTFP